MTHVKSIFPSNHLLICCTEELTEIPHKTDTKSTKKFSLFYINPSFRKAQLTPFCWQSFISDSQTCKPDFKAIHKAAWANSKWQPPKDPLQHSSAILLRYRPPSSTHPYGNPQGSSHPRTEAQGNRSASSSGQPSFLQYPLTPCKGVNLIHTTSPTNLGGKLLSLSWQIREQLLLCSAHGQSHQAVRSLHGQAPLQKQL